MTGRNVRSFKLRPTKRQVIGMALGLLLGWEGSCTGNCFLAGLGLLVGGLSLLFWLTGKVIVDEGFSLTLMGLLSLKIIYWERISTVDKERGMLGSRVRVSLKDGDTAEYHIAVWQSKVFYEMFKGKQSEQGKGDRP